MTRLLEVFIAVYFQASTGYRARYPNNEVKDRSDYGHRAAGRFPISEHPVLLTHPKTKRTALYVRMLASPPASRNLNSDASQAILDFRSRSTSRGAGVLLQVPMAEELDRLLGQPLRPTLRRVRLLPGGAQRQQGDL